MAPLRTHATEESWYFCSFCGRSYLDPKKYTAHLEEHKKEEPVVSTRSQYNDLSEDSEDELLINYGKTNDSVISNPDEGNQNSLRCKVCKKELKNDLQIR